MKVIQILPELESGGVERGTLELAQFLVRQGHDSIVISNGGGMVHELEANGSRHVTLPVHRKSPLTLRVLPALRRALLEERPDILHLRSRVPAWLSWLCWRSLPTVKRPRLVSTVHGFYSVNAYSRIMTRGERVICVSDAIRAYVVNNYPRVPLDKLVVIPRGIDPDLYHPRYRAEDAWRDRWFSEFPQTQGKRWIVLPGRLSQLKGQLEFIELFARLRESVPNLHGLIVGGTHPRKKDYEEGLRRRVVERNLSEDITFTGQRSDLREILSCSALVLSLSRQPESFGRTVLEPLALGKPVIGYSDGGVGEILRVMLPEGIVSRENPEELLARCLIFLENPPMPVASHPFALESMLTETHKLYQTILREPTSA